MARDPGRVLIFDTTLRDGEQSPGASLNLEEKLAIAQQLARLGVDIIEAGFPFASPGDFNAVQRIAATVGTPDGPVICGLARAAQGDIKACAEAVAPAGDFSAASTGAAGVTVTNGAGTSPTTEASTFTYDDVAATVASLSTTTGSVLGGTTVTITGEIGRAHV